MEKHLNRSVAFWIITKQWVSLSNYCFYSIVSANKSWNFPNRYPVLLCMLHAFAELHQFELRKYYNISSRLYDMSWLIWLHKTLIYLTRKCHRKIKQKQTQAILNATPLKKKSEYTPVCSFNFSTGNSE